MQPLHSASTYYGACISTLPQEKDWEEYIINSVEECLEHLIEIKSQLPQKERSLLEKEAKADILINSLDYSEEDIVNIGNDLLRYKRGIGSVVSHIMEKYVPKLDSILEVGAGNLPIREFMHGLTPEIKDNIVISELRPGIVEKLRNKYSNKVLELNVFNLKMDPSSFNAVIGCDIFNTFTSNQQFTTAAQQIKKVLHQNGVFIHFSVRAPYPELTFHQFRNNSKVIFPIINEFQTMSGVRVVDKAELDACIGSIPDSATQELLQHYASLTSIQREIFITQIHSQNEWMKALSCASKMLNCPNSQNFTFEACMANKLKNTFEAQGFKALLSQKMEGHYCSERTPDHDVDPGRNFFFMDRTRRIRSQLSMLAPGRTYESTYVNVLVCRKVD